MQPLHDALPMLLQVGNNQFEEVIRQISPTGLPEWRALQDVMRPLSRAATMLPPAAVRADPAVALTALARFLPSLLQVVPLPKHT